MTVLQHWRSTLLGILIASLGAFATTANLDSLSWRQACIAFAACVLYAIKGALQADAKQTPAPAAPASICPTCGAATGAV